MHVHPSRYLRLLVFLLAAALTVPALSVVAAAPALAANAAPPNVVVVRVGDGTAALTSSSTAVFLDEYAPDGTRVRSTPLPIAASGSNRPLTMSGSATSEGALAQSSDGRYLTLAGYGTAPGLASVGSTPASTTPRVVARVDGTGSIDTTTALTDQPTGNNVRGAVTDAGSRFWVTGAAGGLRFANLGATTSTQVTTAPTNTRAVSIAGGQLYISSSSTPYIGVSSVGTGLPTTTAPATLLTGSGSTSPFAFVFLDRSTSVAGVDSLYVADDSASGGILKFSFDGTTWTSRGSFKPAGSSARGLTGAVQADGTVGLLATTTTGTGSIVAVTDTAAFDAPIAATGTTVATAPVNTAFRGIAFAPQALAAAPTITGQPQDATINPGGTATLSVTATGTEPLSYQWYQGDISHPVAGATNPTFTTPPLTATTSYFVRVSNSADFVDSRTAIVTVNQAAAPSITVQPQDVTINSGATATLSVTAIGAAPLSYQWYQGTASDTSNPINGATNASFTTPALTATMTYWVRVTNSAGTVDSRTTTVTVTPNNTPPTLSPTPVDALGLTLGDPDNPPALRTITIGDVESSPDALTVNVTSNNALVATGASTGTGVTRTLTVTPVGVGRATLTVTVSDGTLSTSTTFQVGVSAALPAGTLNHYGSSDASSTIDLGGGAMVVGDDENNVLRIYDRTHSRYPAQSLDLRAAGLALRDGDPTREIDIEASARTGNTIYWLGSHGQNKDNKLRLNRQELFATTVNGTGTSATLTVAGSYQHLRDDMIAWDHNNGHGLGVDALGLAAAAARAPEGDGTGPTGFNIEGAELSSDGQTLYVGFRGPLVGNKALVVPVTNIAALVTANPTTTASATFGAPLQWDLGGRGIREIRKNASNTYLLLAGPSGEGTGAAGEFHFYSWDGDPAHQPLLRAGSLDQVAGPGKPESIVSVPDPLVDTSTVQVLTDSGDTAFYGDGVIAKDLAGPDMPLRKSTSAMVPVGAPPVCSAVPVSIGSVQGTGDVSPRSGQTVTVRGTVVADYEGASPALRGFYLQDAGDGDNATSDGIFVFDNGADLVANGAVVSVTGPVSEFQGQTQITPAAGGVESCGTQAVVTPTDVTLPRVTPNDLEPYEGMLVRLHQTATVTEEFQLGRFGQVVVSSGGKLQQPTSVLRATDTAAVAAKQAANDLNRLIIDDATQAQNPDPIVFGRGGQPLSASNTLRGGDTVTDPVGVLTYTWAGNAASGNAYRLRPVGALGGTAVFDPTNPRPTAPPAVGTGGLHVASANLLNFFNTFSGCTFGSGGAPADCRGAENAGEYQRQLDKEVASLTFLGADVIGFMEMENDGYGPDSAVQALTNALNSKDGAGTWAFVNPDAATGVTNVAGTDAIKAGLLYKTAKVTPVTGDTLVDQTDLFERRPVAQTFQTPAGARFTVVANHFKSKGSCPTSGPDTDQGDGQSCWNPHRTDQANELARWLHDTVIPQVGDPDVFIVGDLNSYAGEDPIAKLEAAGYTNLAKSYGGPNAYSYVFDGQWGYLDYVMASGSLVPQVTGAGDAHHNADEPSVLDYNTNFKTAGQVTSLYAPDRFRTSDHDPVLVGLNPLAVTTTKLEVSPVSPAAANTPEMLTATVTPTAAGQVQFKDGLNDLGGKVDVTNGKASTTTTLAPGVHSLTAVFTPADPVAFGPSTSDPVSYAVNAVVTTTKLEVSPVSPAAANTPEMLTATVTSTAAGQVQFKDGLNDLGGKVDVTNGKASTTTTLAPGVHSLTAVFTPADPVAFGPSTSDPVSYTVNAVVTTTKLDVSPGSPAAANTPETLTATVTPTAAGSVVFKDGTTVLGAPVSVMAGKASMTTTLVSGSHSLTVVFAPADTVAFGPSTSPAVSYLVSPAATGTRLDVTPVSPAAANTPETLTATVTPTAAGSVVFKDGTTVLGAPVSVMAGKASMTTTLVSGSHSLTAVFAPADTVAFGPSTSPAVSYLVSPVATGTRLDVTPVSPAVAGTVETLTASVTPLAAGRMVFKDGATVLGAPVAVMAGKASMTTTLVPGSHSLTAVFTPADTAAFSPSASPAVTYLVYAVATSTTLQVSGATFQGLPIVLVAGVSPFNAAGMVQFKDGNTAIGASVPVVGGNAILITPAPAKGIHTLTAVFTPTNPTAFGPSTSPPVSVTIRQLFP